MQVALLFGVLKFSKFLLFAFRIVANVLVNMVF